ncbi:unnamed protein product [Scytosiphon promiscuus]
MPAARVSLLGLGAIAHAGSLTAFATTASGAGVNPARSLLCDPGMDGCTSRIKAAKQEASVSLETGGTFTGPFGGIPASVPGSIAAVEFDYGGQGVGYFDATITGDNPRTFRPLEGIDLVPRDDGSWYVGYIDPGEWVRYTVDVSQDVSRFDFEFTAASQDGGGGVRVVADPTSEAKPCQTYRTDLSGFVNITATGGWEQFGSIYVDTSSVPVGGLSAGQRHIWLCFIDPGFNLDSFSLSTSSVAFGSASLMPFDWAWQSGTTANDQLQAAAFGPDGTAVFAGFTSGDWNGAISPDDEEDFDMAAFKLDSDGTLLWKFQKGTAANDFILAAAVAEDGSTVLAGHSDSDFSVIKLDADGNTMWEFKNGTSVADQATGVAISPDDGSVVVVGHTFGSFRGVSAGGWDFAAFKLDSEGTLVWTWQDGTSGADFLNAVTFVDDGVVMAGQTALDFYGPSSGSSDFVAIKLNDADGGAELWRWQGGSGLDDAANAIAATDGGHVVLAGYTNGDFEGQNAGDETSDLTAVKLNGTDGVEVWRWQDGTLQSDELEGVAVQPDGSIILAGTTDGGWSRLDDEASFGFGDFIVAFLTGEGDMIGGYQTGTAGDDQLKAMAASADGRVVIAGFSDGLYTAEAKADAGNLGSNDFLVVSMGISTAADETGSSGVDTTPIIAWGVGAAVFVALIALWVFIKCNKIGPIQDGVDSDDGRA